jgi:putative cell wall-binding protein
MRRMLVLLMAACCWLGLMPVAAAVDDTGTTEPRPARGETQRLSGPTRIETAAEVSRSTFEPDAPVAFIATAAAFPDALAGGPLAARLGAPILLTLPDRLPDATAAELRRLRPARIVLLGGTAAVSAAVADAVAAFTRPAGVDRISGPTRFETAAEIARQGFTAPVGIAFVVTGHDFPDALSGAAAAARLGGPVLLSGTNTLPDAARTALEELKPQRIVILGGSAAVTEGVRNELAFYTSADVERWAGADRYATSAEVAAKAFPAVETTAAFIATGATYPDAVTGAAAAGALRGPLLLSSRFELPDRVAAELARLSPGGLDIFILGGEAAISRQVAEELATYARPTLSTLTVAVSDPVKPGPVAGAQIGLRRGDDVTVATSGADGTHTFEQLVWGRFFVDVTRSGFAAATVEVDLGPGVAGHREVALTRVASITGRVFISGNGTQIPGATVRTRRVVNGVQVGDVFETVTDADGRYLLSAPGGLIPGSYRVTASHEEFESDSVTIDVDHGAWTEGTDIGLVYAS